MGLLVCGLMFVVVLLVEGCFVCVLTVFAFRCLARSGLVLDLMVFVVCICDCGGWFGLII